MQKMKVIYLVKFLNKGCTVVNNQAFLFIIFTLDGILIGILFDCFRVLRKTFKTKDFVTYIEDILFWLFTGFIILYSMCMFCDGELRFFMFIGIIIGIFMYMITISRYVIKVSVFIINFFKKVLAFPFQLIYKVTKKFIFRPILFICVNIRKIFSRNLKENRGFFLKKEKYNSI